MKWMTQGACMGAAALAFVGATAYHSATHPRRPQAGAVTKLYPAPPEDAVVKARITAKEAIARELVAGRLSLLQAAAGFRNLGLQAPPDQMRDVFPLAGSEDEAYCRSVIGYVRSVAPNDQGEIITCVLEAELYDQLQEGTLRLPDSHVDQVPAFPNSVGGPARLTILPRRVPGRAQRLRGNDFLGDSRWSVTLPRHSVEKNWICAAASRPSFRLMR